MESPWLETNVSQGYKNKSVIVLGINLNESLNTVKSYINKHSITYPVLINGTSVYTKYGDNFIPYNVIIDSQRYVKYTSSWFNSSAILSILNTLTTDIEEQNQHKHPNNYNLYQNFPNPFNPITIIKYEIPKRTSVLLKIYNILGEEVKTLVKEEQMPGYYEVIWDGTDKMGLKVSSGIYIYKMETNTDYVKTLKMVFLK